MATKLPSFFYRNIIICRPLQDSLREPLKIQQSLHGDGKGSGGSGMWKKVFIWACVPTICLSAINCLLHEEEEKPEYKPYEHLRIRRKRFPWGDGNKTLFHNKHRNALPEGYEE